MNDCPDEQKVIVNKCIRALTILDTDLSLQSNFWTILGPTLNIQISHDVTDTDRVVNQ